jgi:MFS family permease
MCICSMFLLAGIYGDNFGAYGDKVSMGAILVYNIVAFMTQPFTGLLADRTGRRHWLLMSSALLMTLGVALASLIPMLVADSPHLMGDTFGECMLISVAVLLGAGNSFFHVWGGKQAVVKTGNDMRALGVFVSTGALGLAVGLVFRSWSLLYGLLLLYVGMAVAYVYRDDGLSLPVSDIRLRSPWFTPARIWTLVVALMLFVCYRSFAGEVFSGGITKTEEMILLMAVASMLGKMAGGWIARLLGILWSLMLLLAGVALCFFFRDSDDAVLLVGIFLMNCTMPITLYLANVLLPKREGLAFGLLAAALLPGYLLAVYL